MKVSFFRVLDSLNLLYTQFQWLIGTKAAKEFPLLGWLPSTIKILLKGYFYGCQVYPYNEKMKLSDNQKGGILVNQSHYFC